MQSDICLKTVRLGSWLKKSDTKAKHSSSVKRRHLYSIMLNSGIFLKFIIDLKGKVLRCFRSNPIRAYIKAIKWKLGNKKGQNVKRHLFRIFTQNCSGTFATRILFKDKTGMKASFCNATFDNNEELRIRYTFNLHAIKMHRYLTMLHVKKGS